jgi:hypothetical protein
MTIRPLNEDWTHFEVLSDSGKTYRIEYRFDLDAPRWNCDCPAAKFRGRDCKHVVALCAWIERNA